jgi:Fe-S cluster biogenesis protein NfuA
MCGTSRGTLGKEIKKDMRRRIVDEAMIAQVTMDQKKELSKRNGKQV